MKLKRITQPVTKEIPPIPLSNGYKIVSNGKSFGIENKSGKKIIPISYQSIGWTDHRTSLVKDFIGYKNNDHWGLINLKNHKIAPPTYSSLYPFYEGLLVASIRDKGSVRQKFGIISTNGKVIVPFKYSFLEAVGSNLIAAKVDGNELKYGLINEKDQVIIPFQYNKINGLHSGQIGVSNSHTKFGLFSNDGIQLSGFDFDEITAFDSLYHRVENNGKQGLLDHQGEIIVIPQYKEIKRTIDGKIEGLPYDSWHLLTNGNQLVIELFYDSISRVSNSLLKATLKDNEYIIDLKDNPILPLAKRQYSEFKRGYSIASQGDYYGVINYDKTVIPFKYDSIIQYGNYFAAEMQIATNHEWSIFDGSGNKINKISYDQINGYTNGFFGVKKNGYWGYMNEYGHEVIKARYDSVFTFIYGLAKTKLRGKFGIIDQYGREVVPNNYDKIEIVNKNLFIVSSNFSYGIINRAKGMVYQSYYPLYKEKGFVVEKNNSDEYGLFDVKGQRILSTEYPYLLVGFYDKIHVFGDEHHKGILTKDGGILMGMDEGLEQVGLVSDKYIGIKLNKKYGFIDFDGKLRIANRYDSIGRFGDERAPINLLKKWGYIDVIERFKVQPKYDFAGVFDNGTAIVGNNEKFGIINREGDEVLKLIYDHIRRNSFGNYVTEINRKKGLLKRDGFEAIYPKYLSLTDLGNGNVIVKSNNGFGMVDDKGKTVIPLSYEHLIYDNDYHLFFGHKKSTWQKLGI